MFLSDASVKDMVTSDDDADVSLLSVDIEESTNVDAVTGTCTTITSPDTSPREILRAAAVHDDRLDRIEAIVITAGNMNQLGNCIEYCCLYKLR